MTAIAAQLLKLGFKPSTIMVHRPEPKVRVNLFVKMTTVDIYGKMNVIRNNSSLLDERPVITRHKVPNKELTSVHHYNDGYSLVSMPAEYAAPIAR